MRTTTLTAVGLLGLALLTPAYSASAAAETCRGEAATIVGTGQPVRGTEGRDVIVAGTSSQVDAYGGDDLICLSRGVDAYYVQEIDAGPGNDTVDATAASTDVSTRTALGPGADTFVGGAAQDIVHAGNAPEPRDVVAQPGSDVDGDRVGTGNGDDTVYSGSSGGADHDVVDLGAGDDALFLGTSQLAGDAAFDGGDGEDPLRFGVGSEEVTFDQGTGTFTSAAGTAALTSFASVTVDAGPGKVHYRGTPGDDSLTVRTDGSPVLDLATAAGKDLVVLEPATIGTGSTIDLGGGHDKLVAARRNGSLELDLGFRRRLVVAREKVADVDEVEDAFLMSPQVTMVGSNADNALTFNGCKGTLSGGHGRDFLARIDDYVFESYLFGCRTTTTMRGGPDKDHLSGGLGRDRLRGEGGNDRLEGSSGSDVLVGGGGRDRADGGLGRDRCVAEREKHCER